MNGMFRMPSILKINNHKNSLFLVDNITKSYKKRSFSFVNNNDSSKRKFGFFNYISGKRSCM